MKRLLTALSCLMLLVGCEADISSSVDYTNKLEDLCNRMNNNISALQTVVSALEKNDYVTDISPMVLNGEKMGYTIVFAQSGTINIYHSEDGIDDTNGKEGYIPKIGVRQDTDGFYYWTLDGKWLKDNNDNKIEVERRTGGNSSNGKDTVTPKLRIANDYWEISYDKGQSWRHVGKATGESGKDGVFKSITEDNDNVYMTLADGTEIVMLKMQLELSATPNHIIPNGNDAAVFSATFNGIPVQGFTVYDSEGNTVEDNRFATQTLGTYTFYAVYNYNSTSCRSNNITVTARISELKVSVSSNVIKADGKDAAVINVYADGIDVTKDVVFYDSNDKDITADLATANYTYTTTTTGIFTFWVACGSCTTVDNPTRISAITGEIPEGITDAQPLNLDFKKRVMIMEFTGTGCGYCPYMIAGMRQVLGDKAYNDRFTLAMPHTYNSGDPFYTGLTFAKAFNVAGSAPFVKIDLQQSFFGVYANSANGDEEAQFLRDAIDTWYAEGAKAAIAVNMSVTEDKGVTARMDIKVSETYRYRVGAWILEDRLSASQSNYGATGYYSTHNYVLRHADSNDGTSQYDYYGYHLGTLNVGEYASHTFNIELKETWNIYNCHVVFFVTTVDNNNRTFITNSVDVPLKTQQVAFEYN